MWHSPNSLPPIYSAQTLAHGLFQEFIFASKDRLKNTVMDYLDLHCSELQLAGVQSSLYFPFVIMYLLSAYQYKVLLPATLVTKMHERWTLSSSCLHPRQPAAGVSDCGNTTFGG